MVMRTIILLIERHIIFVFEWNCICPLKNLNLYWHELQIDLPIRNNYYMKMLFEDYMPEHKKVKTEFI